MSVAKSADPVRGKAGTSVKFPLVINNLGTAVMSHVKVTDTLPAGLTYDSTKTPPGDRPDSSTGGVLIWNDIGPLAALTGTRTLELWVTIDGSPLGTLTNPVKAEGVSEYNDQLTKTASATVLAYSVDMSVAKSADPVRGKAGTSVKFPLVINNLGTAVMSHVKVTDTLPAGLTYDSTKTPPGDRPDSSTGGVLIWNDIGPLAALTGTRTLELWVTIDGSPLGTLTNPVKAEGVSEYNDQITKTASATVLAYSVDMSVAKTADPVRGQAGTSVKFPLVITNLGTAEMSHVKVTDTLPAGLTYDPAKTLPADRPDSSTGGILIWNDIGPLAGSGGTRTINLWVTIDGKPLGTLTNPVQADGVSQYGEPITKTASADVFVFSADMSVSKSAVPVRGQAGTSVKFPLVITNLGTAIMSHVKVTDTLPTGLTYDPTKTPVSDRPDTAVGGLLTWNDIGPLAASGGTRTLELWVTIDGSYIGTMTNTVQVDGISEYGDPITKTATADVLSYNVGMDVDKSANPNLGPVGTSIDFPLKIDNKGTAKLVTVTVTDTLPKGLAYNAAKTVPPADSSVTDPATGITTLVWNNVGPLEGTTGTTTIHLWATIDGSYFGKMTNRVDVLGISEYQEPVTGFDTADVTSHNVFMNVDKSANPELGPAGTSINFPLKVDNTGTAKLSTVKVTDTLPKGLTYDAGKSVPPADSSSTDPATGITTLIWNNVGPLNPVTGTITINLWATVDGSILGLMTNRVDVLGVSEHGEEVTGFDTADVRSYSVLMDVDKSAVPEFGPIGTSIDFPMKIDNKGTTKLATVKVTDTLPKGLTYDAGKSVPPADTSSIDPATGITTLTWNNIGPLDAVIGTYTIHLWATIDGSYLGKMTNLVDVHGTSEYGENIDKTDTADVRSGSVSMVVDKAANPDLGQAGTSIDFPLKVTNTGSLKLITVKVTDTLPKGLTYDAGKSVPPADSSSIDPSTGITTLVWNNVGPLDPLTGTTTIHLGATIDGSFIGQMTNVVDVLGTSEFGENIPGSDTADVTSYVSTMAVKKTVDLPSGPIDTVVTFTMKVTNMGTTNLVTAQATDDLPKGLKYIEATPAPSSVTIEPLGNTILVWNNVGPLAANGGTATIVMKAQITGTVEGKMTNQIDVTARTEYGEELKGHDTADVLLEKASIGVTKDAFPDFGLPGTIIEFPIVVKNDGTIDLVQVSATDTLPDGLDYLEDDHGGVVIAPGVIQWSNLETVEGIAFLPPGGEIKINLKTVVKSTIVGELDNVVYASGVPRGGGKPVEKEAKAKVSVKYFGVSKTSDKKIYRPGEEITYTIFVCHLPGATTSLRDVIVKDIFENPGMVDIIGSYPEQMDDGTWHIDEIKPGECAKLILIARTPKIRTTFDLDQSVKGKGFVNVNNDLATSVGPYGIDNCVYVEARMGTEKVTNSTCMGVTIDDTGTELETREHGSGDYASEEKASLKWENRSLKSLKNVSASYSPTTFELPGNKGINYDSKWTEESRAKNHITGAVMHETYRYATDIDRDSYVKMDENGSEMVVDSSFTGKGSIGFFKKATPDAKPKVKPIFESQEDYSGQFQINESFDEYGKNVVTKKGASGVGFVASDKRIRDSQRTYESGTGSYQSEEIVDTFTNYIAKDIEATHEPSSYNYSPSVVANQDMKWNEGMWSKSGKLRGGVIVAANDSTGAASVEAPCNTTNKGAAPATIISEKYSSLEYLKKDTVALGLNEMKTNATFNGVADFRASSVGVNGSDAIDNEERYVGEYSINRHVLMTGSSKYDYPHITVTKEGVKKSEWFNLINSTVGDYTITVTNDGNRALAPVYVADFFPPGTQYISASVKPTTLTDKTANWTILHLGIGNSLTINLKLNITEFAPDSVLNCVQVSGLAGESMVASTNCTSLDSAWLRCCESKVSAEKSAKLDATDPAVVHYTITLHNHANSSWAAKVTDQIPADMTLLNSSIEPYSKDPIYISWNFANLAPDEVVTIEYSMRAARNGAYTNKVHVDAIAVDGSGSGSADAYAYADVKGTGVAPRTLRYDGWQPPDWDLNTSEEGITI
jgi:uncharacterized repeat protein (TIGR01451 family)